MKNDKILYLILFQFIIITGIQFINMTHTLQFILFILLILITISLFFKRLYCIETRKSIVTKLERVILGNFQTRLYTNNDRSLDNVIFHVNELITKLEKVQIEAKKSQKARKQLLSSISHDIRTPLTSIIGYIDALKDGIATSKEEELEYLEILSNKSNSLKQLVDEIFHMAKIDADELPFKEEQLDLSEITRETLIEFLPELSKYHIELKIDIPEKPCLITGDSFHIIRVMNNLIKNAIHYGKQGAILGVKLLEHHNEYHILVWDKGPGIPHQDLEHVFERMYRIDQSRTLSSRSSGLGLAIAKALVEKHRGRIWVESIPWERTTFGFSIPKQNSFKK
ncbi:sensor histidine kinase [Bacillus cytotoxicus]|uniref:histidine kinase n=1 Tax=Bacillus cytotoxicus TaxID=580165 RepID=A0AAX2CCB8_9BACI|nr:HAMP domain-containing sensor histidine kinase [Bacillus cytotoxicus]AWC31298.1 sensor histidine kinase [Bacillus cytotoxicus]AWC35339.1 sensor histidine kinase [Bacillus cytotoxicus]AWC59566.1 sensor histidine kinase [Bacillus cytotoxicus]QTR71437.1 HAMP domain-containing histidine kinase [Bacillus cytotoxicus]QTR80301.1 HAMP domain-containing histidine kinase [Bacillus cytotoxicus]